MGSGHYSDSLYVRHADGKVYEYYIEANPIGSDNVYFKRCQEGKSAEILTNDPCKGGKNVNDRNQPLDVNGDVTSEEEDED